MKKFIRPKYPKNTSIAFTDKKGHDLRPVSYVPMYSRTKNKIIPLILYCSECKLFFSVRINVIKIRIGASA